MGENTSESADCRQLEAIMSKCSPEIKAASESANGADYLAFSRRGIVYGIAAVPGSLPELGAIQRKDITEVIGMIGADNILIQSQAPANEIVCLASHQFERQRQYDVPDGAEYIRRGGRKLKFFAGTPLSPETNAKKRKFVRIPENAVSVVCDGSSYTWDCRQ